MLCLRVSSPACRCGWQLQGIAKQQDGTFQLTYDTPEGRQRIQTRSVALTVPAYTAAAMLPQECSAAAEALNAFDYPPVAAVTLAYPLEAIRPDRKDKEGRLPGDLMLLLWPHPCVTGRAGIASGGHFLHMGCRYQ